MEDSSSYLFNIDSAVEHHVGKSGVKVFHSSNLFVNLDVAKSCILSYTQEICVVVSAQQLWKLSGDEAGDSGDNWCWAKQSQVEFELVGLVGKVS